MSSSASVMSLTKRRCTAREGVTARKGIRGGGEGGVGSGGGGGEERGGKGGEGSGGRFRNKRRGWNTSTRLFLDASKHRPRGRERCCVTTWESFSEGGAREMAIAEKETRDGRDRAKRSKERASERADERKREMRERGRYHSDVIAISWFDMFFQ